MLLNLTWSVRAYSKMRSISADTSLTQADLGLVRSRIALLDGLFSRFRLAIEMSAVTRVMIILRTWSQCDGLRVQVSGDAGSRAGWMSL